MEVRTITVEEIEIIVTAKVEEALKEFKKIVPNIQTITGQIEKEFDNVNLNGMIAETKKASNAVKEAFNPNELNPEFLKKLDAMKPTIKGISNEYSRLTKVAKTANAEVSDTSMPTTNKQEYSAYVTAGDRLNSANNTSKEIDVKPSNESLSIWDTLRNKIQQVVPFISKIKAKLSGGLFNSNNTGSKQLELLNYKISEVEEKLQNTKEGKIHLNSKEIIEAEAELEKLNAQKLKFENDGGGSGGNVFSKMSSSLKSVSGNVFSKMSASLNSVKSQFNGISKVIVKVKNQISGMGSGIKQGVGQVLKYATALFSLRGIYSILSQSAQSWLSSQNSGAQQLSANIEYMKYAMGSVFAPVIEYVINLVYKLMKAIQSVAYALTGVNIFAKATAKSMNSTSKSASKTSKSLASIHSEINNVSDNSGSGDSGGSASPSIDLSQMENTPNSIIDAIKNGDWYSIGTAIGQKINDALESIDWNSIQNKVKSIATNLANLFNGLVDGINWNLIGTTIGNGINTALLFAYTFMTTFNWGNFGKAIATGLNGIFNTVDFTLLGQTFASKWVALINFLYEFVSTFDWSNFGISIAEAVMGWWNSIDWAKASETISTGILGLLTTVKEFIANIDWQQLGNDVWTFISTIDWGGIIENLAYILGEAIAGIGQFIWGFIDDAVTSIRDYFAEKITEAGGDVGQGLLNGIVDALKNIGTWINDHIFQPFINGFKNLFGIHSPSTVMSELGTYIIQGLLNGISSLLSNIDAIWNNIKSKMQSGAQQAWNAIINVFSNLGSRMQSIFSNAWTAVKNVFSAGGQIFAGIKEGIESTFKTIVNGLIDGINQVVSKPFNAINNAINRVRGISIAGISPFSWLPTVSVPKIPKLAKGNVAYDETVAIFGEYSNARSNPEITTPQNILRETFRDELQNYSNNQNNSGNGLNKIVVQFGSVQVALEIEKLLSKARRQNGTATVTI